MNHLPCQAQLVNTLHNNRWSLNNGIRPDNIHSPFLKIGKESHDLWVSRHHGAKSFCNDLVFPGFLSVSFSRFIGSPTVGRIPGEMGYLGLCPGALLWPEIIDIIFNRPCCRLTITPAVHIIPCGGIKLRITKTDPIAYDAVPLENGFHHLLVGRGPHLNDGGFGCPHPESLVG